MENLNDFMIGKNRLDITEEDINRQMCNFFILDSYMERARIIKSEEFRINIYYSLKNLKNEEKLFDFKNKEEQWCFYNKYFYSINILLHSLNGYLLDIYRMVNSVNPEPKWEDIFDSGTRNSNNLVGLFYKYIDIKYLIESMNGYYDEDLNEPINSNKIFYLRKGYDIKTDERIVWIGKSNK